MKDTTKEFAKDCGNVAIESVKTIAVGNVITLGSAATVTEVLVVAYNLGCKILRFTPEGKALEIAAKAIAYGGFVGGAVLSTYLNYKLDTTEGFENALEDVTDKYFKKDSTVTVKLNWKPVIPE